MKSNFFFFDDFIFEIIYEIDMFHYSYRHEQKSVDRQYDRQCRSQSSFRDIKDDPIEIQIQMNSELESITSFLSFNFLNSLMLFQLSWRIIFKFWVSYFSILS